MPSGPLTSSARVAGAPNTTFEHTYFRIEFEAEQLASATAAGSAAAADLFLQVSLAGQPAWTVIDTANGVPIPTGPILYSYDTVDYYEITNSGFPTYSIGVVATASATASTTTTSVPLAPSPLLLAPGLIWLMVRRSLRPSRRTEDPRLESRQPST